MIGLEAVTFESVSTVLQKVTGLAFQFMHVFPYVCNMCMAVFECLFEICTRASRGCLFPLRPISG